MTKNAYYATRTRCVCARCARVKYLESAGIDSAEPFLCETCDDLYVKWCNAAFVTYRSAGAMLACFLHAYPARGRR